MMLFSSRLWRALNNPPRNHPLFERLDRVLTDHKTINILISVGGLLLVGLIFFIPLVAIPLLIIGANIALSLRIGGVLAHEHERGTYDLLAVQPQGALFGEWVIAAREYHRFHNTSFYRQFDDSYHNLMRFDRVTMLIFAVILFIFMPMSPLVLILVWLMMYESRQLRLNALLIGMICSSSGSHLEAQVRAVGSFGLLQMVVYLAVIGEAVFIAPILSMPTGNSLSEILSIFISVVAVIATLLGMRESVLYLLWRMLLRRTDADQTALQQITFS